MFPNIPRLIHQATRHIEQGELMLAQQALEKVLAVQPREFDALRILGVVHSLQKDYPLALAVFRKALSIRKNDGMLHFNLAKSLAESGADAEALEHHKKAIQLAPDHAGAWLGYGTSLVRLGRIDEALDIYERALQRYPAYIEVHINKGIAHAEQHDFDAAVRCFQDALNISPQHANGHWNLALARLRMGQFGAAWDDFEYRRGLSGNKAPESTRHRPQWTGQASGSTLLFWGEQGLGDQILYSSILPELTSFPQRKLVALDQRLIPLYQRSIPGFDYISLSQIDGTLDFAEHLPLGSLPRLFRPDLASFRRATYPFLRADPDLTKALRKQLSRPGKLICGISWISHREKWGGRKSISLAELLPPLASDALQFVDLQYGDTDMERSALEESHGIQIQHIDSIDNHQDIDGLAALMSACDCIITVSNSTAHLAGALGLPTLLLAPRGEGRFWYWVSHEGRNPWYPAVRSIEQTTMGDWGPVLSKVRAHLHATGQSSDHHA
ncbi:MAG: tetratricopeptide repeat protein [Hylemonella sp.]|uniref:tetratricopeptide repeat-containing glycosyltransferase family protein n=1 Tax=Hylemonella sp. TaxID=2066020 RepID=UPI00391D505A